MTIDLNPLLNAVVWPFLGVLAVAFAGVIAAKLNTWLGLKADTIRQDTIETALQNALQLAQAKVASSNIASIAVQSRIVADASNYVVAHTPDALKAIGLDVTTDEGRRQLAEKLEARLAPAVLAGASGEVGLSVGAAATIANPAIVTTAIPSDAKPTA